MYLFRKSKVFKDVFCKKFINDFKISIKITLLIIESYINNKLLRNIKVFYKIFLIIKNVALNALFNI